MNPEGWHNVDRLFQVAVEIEPSRRAAYLENACAGDWVLRSEVEELLSNDSLSWDFLEQPAIESAAFFLADDEPVLSPGERVSHYEIIGLLGKGGMGEVYLACDRILNRNIALKFLPFDYTQDATRLQRFQREAQAVSTLNHPNIITIHELGSVGDQQYIATEFVGGETLHELISRRMSVDEVLEISIQIAGALAAAHEAGIIHRDIKPENVMVRHDGYVKVLDFGLAKLIGEFELRSETGFGERVDLSSGLLMGTLRYMSPEQVNGDQVDARSDIFSLGSVIYEMITGLPAFDDKNPANLGQSILKDHPALSDLPEELRAIVAKMLSKDKRNRYANAVELARDLNILKGSLHVGQPRARASLISARPAFL
ncbi:MAG TPA: serine/threonine-protein kinase, partial [Pyrinomonadaceae bacterium]|nr:serine/threonine-protein kinase [Pyrinomonadaceae bacterium]